MKVKTTGRSGIKSGCGSMGFFAQVVAILGLCFSRGQWRKAWLWNGERSLCATQPGVRAHWPLPGTGHRGTRNQAGHLSFASTEAGCSQEEGPKKGFVMGSRTQGVQEILEKCM